MKARALLLASVLTWVAACSVVRPTAAPSPVPDDALTITVIGTNDVHGAFLGSDNSGGMTLFAGYVNNLRAQRAAQGGAVLLVDAGDMWQGTLESNLTEGASVVAAYNAIGYTAAALGNHEFDFGPVGAATVPESDDDDPQGVIKARALEAQFPMLAANLIDLDTNLPVAWPNVQPSVIVDAAGVKIGIIGVMTENALLTTILANTRGLRVAPIAQTIQVEAERLRQFGASVIIVTAHAGSRCTEFDDPYDLSSCSQQGEIFRVANALEPGTVDVIIGGHAHEGIAHFVNGIAVASAFSRSSAFDRIDLYVDPSSDSLLGSKIHPPQMLCRYLSIKPGVCAIQEHADVPLAPAVYAGLTVIPDLALAETIAPALQMAEELKSAELGVHLEEPFRRSDIPETSVGNLLMDILLESAADADFAIHNSRGGIRADLPAGPLNYGKLYEMFPFDNRRVTIELTGAQLRQVMAKQMTSGRWRAGFSGGKVIATCNDDALDVRIVRASGEDVQDGDAVRIVTADFLTTGGDAIFSDVIPPGGFPVDHDAPLIRDVLETYLLERGGSLSPDMFFDEENRRFVYESRPPIRCDS
ncbi:MAG: bifunctional metallophosphatase/5'-nucleotidase [Gammaproteobacteria bacterium]|nr:bifunctional metallophosphatase/5'-nucleotidase [Gammaproteobacteria bacterium]